MSKPSTPRPPTRDSAAGVDDHAAPGGRSDATADPGSESESLGQTRTLNDQRTSPDRDWAERHAAVDASSSPAHQPTEVTGSRAGLPRDRPLSRGQLVGRYVIVDGLGAGGMGIVYRAFDPDLDRTVALKLVAVNRDNAGEERSRLLREAQAMARLSHPNVIPVFDVGLQQNAVFVAMELVVGQTLNDWLKGERRPWRDIVDKFVQAGRGLSAAHAADLIHRDFKPDNVMVGTDGRVRVLDFGLARGTSNADDRGDADETTEFRMISGSKISGGGSLEISLTAAGAVMGTPAYMSPEQHLGSHVSAASDQFSFCVALWEAVYGERPFAGQTLQVLAAHVVQGKRREAPSGTTVPSWIGAALVRGLTVDDDKRHTSMDTLLRVLTHDPRTRRRTVAVLVGSGAAILAVGSALGVRVGRTAAVTAAPKDLCTGSSAAMAGTWNDSRRDGLAKAFLDTGLPYAPAVLSNAAARIDSYAAAWVDERTAACQATRVTGEQSEARLDRRMLCLSREREALDGLLTAMAEPDDATVERTIDAVRSLPKIAACAEEDLDSVIRLTPDDPTQRRAIEDARRVLAAVGARAALGHYTTARLALAPVLVTDIAMDYPPLTLEARTWHGDIEAASGAPAIAREAYLRAYTAATTLDDVRSQAHLAGELAYEFGYRAADAERGTQWLSLARALVRRGGADPDQTAQLDSAQGAALVAAGDYEAALRAHERALAYWLAHAPQSVAAARVMDDIGAVEVTLGKLDEAIARHAAARTIRRRVYGDNHPNVAASERELGSALSKAGRDEEALAPLTRALAINRAALGNNNTHVAVCLDDLGRIERRRGNLEDALALHQEALGIWQVLLGEQHPDVAVSLLGIGYTLVAANKPGEAVAVQRRALRMFEATVGGEHPYVIYAANALGMAMVSSGDPAGAMAPLNQALALRGKVEIDPTLFADTLFALGKAQWRTATTNAQRQAGRARSKAARELFATQEGRWTEQLAEIDAWLTSPS